MEQVYVPKDFRPDTLSYISILRGIVDEYQALGFVLTVRQLYYQLVARGVIPNTLQEYKRTAAIINDAKLAGMLDWDAIEDRTRDFVRQARWNSGSEILRACVRSYHQDMWIDQETRVFVVVEKEALVGVLAGVCSKFDVPLLAARGYPSGTVLREFAESDLLPALAQNQRAVILHLGDHDPSGIDMTRDLQDRISLFVGDDAYSVELQRIALNMPQIEEQRPPENPAKVTDSRFESYRRRFGGKSWELDALTPTYLAELLISHIRPHIDQKAWDNTIEQINEVKDRMREVADSWDLSNT